MTPNLPLLAIATLVAGLLGGGGAPDDTPVENARHPRPTGRAGVAEHAAARGAAEQRRVLRYWTPRRMARAIPIDVITALRDGGAAGILAAVSGPGSAGPAPTRATSAARAAAPGRARAVLVTEGSPWGFAGSVTRTTGRVFLTIAGADFVCSAGTVRSASRDLVVTAGHCVKDGVGAWARNWTFVPGYSDGHRPYGEFTARRMFVPEPWSRRGDDSHDLGMVALNTRRGRHVADLVGAQEIAFNGGRGQRTHVFGFPADPPYDGQRLVYCAGPVRADPHGQTHDQGLPCDMTAGSSGGPWFSRFDERSGRGTVTSVSSFKYTDDQAVMYGPYFGRAAEELYARAQRA
ncbi:trypsin-like peptidase domain-containing protein [Spongiactinospora sp. TRM90649]|uniref:trypsin-like serine peptidase n=1 Tax=Spongiactinospora sp. TRM90649 TaxID=3031114 RepID=UPI0023F9A057|nr:trypsin-like peptidase domain-containing protein [Spongiactinospora sp. TRM90649]MDF5753944.1 hypothetical protein [Spongiactinospora sp. TRM90649]